LASINTPDDRSGRESVILRTGDGESLPIYIYDPGVPGNTDAADPYTNINKTIALTTCIKIDAIPCARDDGAAGAT
jgi:hypothetical protein